MPGNFSQSRKGDNMVEKTYRPGDPVRLTVDLPDYLAALEFLEKARGSGILPPGTVVFDEAGRALIEKSERG